MENTEVVHDPTEVVHDPTVYIKLFELGILTAEDLLNQLDIEDAEVLVARAERDGRNRFGKDFELSLTTMVQEFHVLWEVLKIIIPSLSPETQAEIEKIRSSHDV